jgi:cytochrome c-type biogenesis protein CcmH
MSFWIVIAALLALALAILIVPMLRARVQLPTDQRLQQNIQIAKEKKALLEVQLAEGEMDQAAYDAAYLDLQTALALELDSAEAGDASERGKWMSLVVLLAVPCASVLLYLNYGEYRVIENPQLAEASAPRQNAAAPQMSLDEMVAVIENRISENPDDAEAWFMLGRANMSRRQFEPAIDAFRRANELIAGEPGILFALADALAMQKNGLLTGEPEELILQGLKIAPRFPNGLWLAGMAAEQRGDFAAAHHYWSLLLPMIAENPESTNEVRQLLAMLEQRDPSLTQASVVEAPAAAQQLTLRVDIDSELRARADPGTAVFVYAKAMQGPPMPLAVKRLRLQDLPVTLSLGDADAMMPAMKLSSFDQVIVGARVSFSGNPVAQSGDFFTEKNSIDSNNPPAQISLTINQVK